MRAIEIIQAALYADPMMDEVVVVKEVLGKIPQPFALLLIGIASGVPIQVYKNFMSYKISDYVKEAAEAFITELNKVYAE
jgi:hypothetical protein